MQDGALHDAPLVAGQRREGVVLAILGSGDSLLEVRGALALIDVLPGASTDLLSKGAAVNDAQRHELAQELLRHPHGDWPVCWHCAVLRQSGARQRVLARWQRGEPGAPVLVQHSISSFGRRVDADCVRRYARLRAVTVTADVLVTRHIDRYGSAVSPLQDEVFKIMRTALIYAEGHLLKGETPLDTDLADAADLPYDYKRVLLAALAADPGFTARELEIHQGRPPIEADRSTHTVMAEMLRQSFPGCYVVGEEATEIEWASAEQAPAGSLIFSVDAIDGSLPYETLTFGYSTNVLAFRRTEVSTHLLLAAVANSSHFVAAYADPNTVSVGSLRDYGLRSLQDPLAVSRGVTETLSPMHEDFCDGTVAVVAAQARHRLRAEKLFSDSELILFTTGGAPAALGLIMGKLEALVSTSRQTTHDAAYLPILAFLGMTIITDRQIHLGLPDVLNFFSQVAISEEDRLAHPVPSFVAARNPQTAGRLARAVFT